MDKEVEFAPILGNALEHRLHLSGDSRIERHHDRRLEFARQRLDIFLGLVVEIGDRQFRAQRAKRRGAAPGDRLLVGDADNEPSLAVQQLGFHGGKRKRIPLSLVLRRHLTLACRSSGAGGSAIGHRPSDCAHYLLAVIE